MSAQPKKTFPSLIKAEEEARNPRQPLRIVMEPVPIEQRVRELQQEATQLKAEARKEALESWDSFAAKLQHVINNPDIYGAGFADIARGLSSQLEGNRQSLDKILQQG